eukprot:gene7363-7574_t
MSPYPPVPGLRGMLQREPQDWGPIQRFIDGSVGTQQLLPVRQQGHDTAVSQPGKQQLRTSSAGSEHHAGGAATLSHPSVDEPFPGGERSELLPWPVAAAAAAVPAAVSAGHAFGGAFASSTLPSAAGVQSGFWSGGLSQGIGSPGADSVLLAIAAFALVQVSVVGCVTLLVALWSLLAPSRFGRQVFAVTSPGMLLLYTLWLVDAYVATALDGLVAMPALFSSIGIWGYHKQYPALLPLLLHLLTTVAVAGLSRSRVMGPTASSSGDVNVSMPGSSCADASTDVGLAWNNSTAESAAAEVDSGAAGVIFLPAAAVAAAGLGGGVVQWPAVSTRSSDALGPGELSGASPGAGHGLETERSWGVADSGVAASVAAAGRELRHLMSMGANRGTSGG